MSFNVAEDMVVVSPIAVYGNGELIWKWSGSRGGKLRFEIGESCALSVSQR